MVSILSQSQCVKFVYTQDCPRPWNVHIVGHSVWLSHFPVANNITETERSSGSLETLKLVFNVSGDEQGSHPDDLFISVTDPHDVECAPM